MPAAVMTVLFYFIRRIYINAGREFKRIELLSKSKISNIINPSIDKN